MMRTGRSTRGGPGGGWRRSSSAVRPDSRPRGESRPTGWGPSPSRSPKPGDHDLGRPGAPPRRPAWPPVPFAASHGDDLNAPPPTPPAAGTSSCTLRCHDQAAGPTEPALELVSYDEAAALAARPVDGRRRQERSDGAAVDAMRSCGHRPDGPGSSSSARARDEAPMLFTVSASRRTPMLTDIAVTDRRHDADRPRPWWGHLGHRGVRAGHDFEPGPCFYMEKIAVGPDAVGVIDITRSATDNLRRWPRPRARASGTSPRDPRPPATPSSSPRAGRRSPHPTHPDGDVAGAISTPGQTRGRHPLASAAPRGVITAAALKCRAASSKAACGRARGERAAAIAAGTTSARCSPPTTSCPVTTASRRHRHHRRRPPQGRALRLPSATTIVGDASKSGTVRQINAATSSPS